jgi:hypothetical protein
VRARAPGRVGGLRRGGPGARVWDGDGRARPRPSAAPSGAWPGPGTPRRVPRGCPRSETRSPAPSGGRRAPRHRSLGVAALLPAGRAGARGGAGEGGGRVQGVQVEGRGGRGRRRDGAPRRPDRRAARGIEDQARRERRVGPEDGRAVARPRADRPVEFVEQPVAPDSPRGPTTACMGLAADYPVPIALDESIAGDADVGRWLDAGWRGYLSSSPPCSGTLPACLDGSPPAHSRVVFSSALETAIGAQAALRLGVRLAGQELRRSDSASGRSSPTPRFDGPRRRRSSARGRRTDQPGGPMERGELAGASGRPAPGVPAVVVEEGEPRVHGGSFAAAVSARGPRLPRQPVVAIPERAELSRLAGSGPRRRARLAHDPERRRRGRAQVRAPRRLDDRGRGRGVSAPISARAGERGGRPSPAPRERPHGLDAQRADGRRFHPVVVEGRSRRAASRRAFPRTAASRLCRRSCSGSSSSDEAVAWLRRSGSSSSGAGRPGRGSSRGGAPRAAAFALLRGDGDRGDGRGAQARAVPGGDSGVRPPLAPRRDRHCRRRRCGSPGSRSSGATFPALRDERSWVTGTWGVRPPTGSLVILGRSDDLIVTGGKKVSPAGGRGRPAG